MTKAIKYESSSKTVCNPHVLKWVKMQQSSNSADMRFVQRLRVDITDVDDKQRDEHGEQTQAQHQRLIPVGRDEEQRKLCDKNKVILGAQ